MKRIRFGLRLLLLFVALFGVFFAWVGARRELQRVQIRGNIRGMELNRAYAATRLDDPQEGKHWRKSLIEAEEAIASMRRQLGESDR
jgi:hypothetical protein